MERSLQAVKERVSEVFLGRGGIHGVGIRLSQNAICLYVHVVPGTDRERVIEAVRREAAPFGVIIVEEEPPVALGGGDG